MKITVDTNILYQALYSRAGASHAILKLIRSNEIQLALSIPVYEEYSDVLSRPKTRKELDLSEEELTHVLDFIAFIGVPTSIKYLWRPNLRHEKDNIFIELAFASGSNYLITRNIRDYTIENELRFDSFKVATPHEFLKEWRKNYAE